MAEMIERVARALSKKQFGTDRHWTEWMDMAEAAIVSMQDPTDTMIAGGVARDPLACDVKPDDVKMVYTRIWQGMIDAALTQS